MDKSRERTKNQFSHKNLLGRGISSFFYQFDKHIRAALEYPRSRVLDILRRWFFRKKVPALFGPDERLFHEEDLHALHPAQDHYQLSQHLRKLGYLFKVVI